MSVAARTGSTEERPQSDALVVFGFSGDLASKKIFPGRLVRCDFIGFCQGLNPLGNRHGLLMASYDSSTNALIERYRRQRRADPLSIPA